MGNLPSVTVQVSADYGCALDVFDQAGQQISEQSETSIHQYAGRPDRAQMRCS